jgi:uncharacterized membrane protein YfcA
MVYVLHMDQHLAQGTSLFILLPPIGLGALRQYWKAGNVDSRAGILCAVGMILGASIGGKIAVPMSTPTLKALFGGFLMFSAVLMWFKAKPAQPGASGAMSRAAREPAGARGRRGVADGRNRRDRVGLFGIGGGVIMVPILDCCWDSASTAQGTSLIALILPTGILAVLAYAKAGYVSWQTGLLLIPGVFLGGIAGGALAKRIASGKMRRIFASLMFLLGVYQVASALRG